MISVEEARNIINAQKADWGTEEIEIAQCVGRVLATDILADRDFPPFDRVAMDGIALSYGEYEKGRREFEITDIQLAGEPSRELTNSAHTIEIMTGAILAKGCDMVIRYEDLEFSEKEGKKWIKVLDENGKRWKNVHRQASDSALGDLMVKKASVINSAVVSILATVGCANVKVKRLPKVAVISTGDELVGVDQIPEPHQIRKSNTISIQAELNKRAIPNQLFHFLDNKENLKKQLSKVLEEFDVLLLSGGVSKGKADFLPDVFEDLKVKKLFHRVAQRPGKPFWFGVSEDEKPVFAFPGNPISTLMCFRVYFFDWLDISLLGAQKKQKAILGEDFTFKANLGYFLQVRSEQNEKGEIVVYPELGNGSGDITNLAKSDGFMYLPAGKEIYKEGEFFEYCRFS